MTVSTTGNSAGPYVANGVTTDFAFPYPFRATTDILVYDLSTDTRITTGFTTTGTPDGNGGYISGTVAFSPAPAAPIRIALLRATTLTQDVNFVPNDPFPAPSNNAGLDKAMLGIQDVNARAARAIQFPAYYPPFDPTEFAGQNLAFDSNGVPIPGSDAIVFTNIGDAAERSVVSRLRDTVHLADYYFSTDNGTFDNAFQRAFGVHPAGLEIMLPMGETINVSGTIATERGLLSIAGPEGQQLCTINVTGADTKAFSFASNSTFRYCVALKRFIITRTSSVTDDAAIEFTNMWWPELESVRIFSNSKFWRGLDLTSASYARIHGQCRFDLVRREGIWIRGGSAGAGAIGGTAGDIRIEGLIVDGAHDNTADPVDQGVILSDDYCGAIWTRDVEVFRHRGYAVYHRGTPANITANGLNEHLNLNVEATYANSGVIRFGSVQTSRLGVGWGSGNGIPAVWFDPNAQGCSVDGGYDIGQAGAASGILNNGTDCGARNVNLTGNDTSALAANYFDATCIGGYVENMRVGGTSFLHAVENAAIANAGIKVDNIIYRNLRGSDIAGFSASGNQSIAGVYNSGAAVATVASASSITIPPGVDLVALSGTTAINTIAASWPGRIQWVRLAAGGRINDDSVSAGNVSLPSGTTLIGDGVQVQQLRCLGSTWEAIICAPAGTAVGPDIYASSYGWSASATGAANTAALQAAVNAAGVAGGGRVLLGYGQFPMATVVYVEYDNVRIEGINGGTVILYSGTGTAIHFRYVGAGLRGNVGLKGVRIYCTNTSTTAPGWIAENCQNSLFEDVQTDEFFGSALVKGCLNCSFIATSGSGGGTWPGQKAGSYGMKFEAGSLYTSVALNVTGANYAGLANRREHSLIVAAADGVAFTSVWFFGGYSSNLLVEPTSDATQITGLEFANWGFDTSASGYNMIFRTTGTQTAEYGGFTFASGYAYNGGIGHVLIDGVFSRSCSLGNGAWLNAQVAGPSVLVTKGKGWDFSGLGLDTIPSSAVGIDIVDGQDIAVGSIVHTRSAAETPAAIVRVNSATAENINIAGPIVCNGVTEPIIVNSHVAGSVTVKPGCVQARNTTWSLTAASALHIPLGLPIYDVTGNTAIASYTGLIKNYDFRLRFAGTPQLTNGATQLLNGSTNVTVTAGSIVSFNANSATGVSETSRMIR